MTFINLINVIKKHLRRMLIDVVLCLHLYSGLFGKKTYHTGLVFSQVTFTCLRTTIDTLEKGIKYVQI